MNGQRHAGTRQNGRDFSERDARGELRDSSDNQTPLADSSDRDVGIDLKARDLPPTAAEKSDLIVDPGDLPATARELRDVLAASGRFFDRGVPVKVVPAADGGPPTTMRLTPNRIVIEAHDLCRPIKPQGDALKPVTLPGPVARLYLEMAGEWDLSPLAGITTAPVLAPDGTVRTAEGYDPMTQLWCARVPILTIPDEPGPQEAEGALRLLRETFRSFPFADAPRIHDQSLGAEVVDLDQPPCLDESTFLVGLILRSDILASVLTERPARVRPLGRTGMVALNSTAFIAVTGNGLSVSEDLARRFMVCELDARCEDPEQRPFTDGFLAGIELRRAELLSAALTVWRWGRQNSGELQPGRPLGSFEQWAAWCRDPLLALGCRDPVERIDEIKSDDPHRRQIVELTWHAHHGDEPVKAKVIAEPVRALLDPQRRGRQFMTVASFSSRAHAPVALSSRARRRPENGGRRPIP